MLYLINLVTGSWIFFIIDLEKLKVGYSKLNDENFTLVTLFL